MRGLLQACLRYLPSLFRVAEIGPALNSETLPNRTTSDGAPFIETAEILTLLNANKLTLSNRNLKRIKIGDLRLSSGRIVVADPLTVSLHNQPLITTVDPGTYPVFIYVVDDKAWGKRVALAELRFQKKKPVSWSMALLAGQDLGHLNEREYFGYGVDTGLGSFMSVEALANLDAAFSRAERDIPNFLDYYTNVLAEELDKTSPPYALHEPAADSPDKVAIFESGFGD